MKKYMLGVLLLPALAVAEPVIVDKKVVCDKLETIFKVLTEEHGETPSWIGSDKNKNSQYTLLLNTKTATWTLIQFNNKTACIIGDGEGFNLKLPQN